MSNDIRLIMENWRSYVAQEAMVSIPVTNVGDTNIFLLEGKEVKQITFGRLMEQHNSGKISSDQFVRLWEQSMDYEYNLLLQEGVIDLARRVNSFIKEKGAKAWDSISNAAAAAWTKVTSFIGNAVKQAFEFADKNFIKADIAMRALKEKVTKMAGEEDSIIKDAAFMAIAMIGCFAIYKIMKQVGIEGGLEDMAQQLGDAAGAAIVDADGEALTTNRINAMVGEMNNAVRAAGTINEKASILQSIGEVQQAAASNQQIPLSTLGEIAQSAFNEIEELSRAFDNILKAAEETAKIDSPAAREHFKDLMDAAQEINNDVLAMQKSGASTKVVTTSRGGIGF